jgi:hypothetical protein
MVDGEEDLRFRFLRHVNSTLVGIAFLALPLFPADSTNTPQQTRVISTYGRLPPAFEANIGQFDSNVRFAARNDGHAVLLKAGEAVITLSRKPKGGMNAVRMKFLGTKASSQMIGEEELPGKSNYFTGADPRNWYTNIPTYARVRQRGLYAGVDLVYRSTNRQIEYDLVLAPGSHPETIRLAVDGLRNLAINAEGDLILRTRSGIIRQRKPFAYQEIGSRKQPVPCRYALKGRRLVGFVVGDYDITKPLIIDPVLNYSTFLGGAGNDSANGIAVDAEGNAYVLGGSDAGLGYPPTAGSLQSGIFVTKFNSDGTAVLYSTFIGQVSSSAGGIAVDSGGNAYITGSAYAGFPLVNPIQTYVGGLGCGSLGNSICPDAFVAKLNATGSAFIYSTYFGGVGNDVARSIVVDPDGNAYITGNTKAKDFPTTSGAFQRVSTSSPSTVFGDAFVSKISAAGSALVYSLILAAPATHTAPLDTVSLWILQATPM